MRAAPEREFFGIDKRHGFDVECVLMLMKKLLPLLLLWISLLPGPLWAAEKESIPVDPDFKPSRFDPYVSAVMEKFDFGAVNFLAGWTEIISEPMDHAQGKSGKKQRFLAGTAGLGEGLVDGLLNTVGGFANLFTAPVPNFRIPLPEKGVDLARLTAPQTPAA